MALLSDELKLIICTNLGCEAEAISEDTKLVNDLGADSLDIVEISIEVEDQYGIEINELDAEPLSTFGELVELVQRKLAEASATPTSTTRKETN